MTNIFNYRYSNITEALNAVERLENKLKGKPNRSVTVTYSKYKYWNLRLSITNDEPNKEKTRVFNTIVS